MGVKIIFASIGAGPIQHPLSRWFMKSAARAAHYRSYRDTVSKAFMESIGFDARNDPIYPDIAFALSAPSALPAGGRGPAAYHRRWGHGLSRLAQRPRPRRRDLCRLPREDDPLRAVAFSIAAISCAS